MIYTYTYTYSYSKILFEYYQIYFVFFLTSQIIDYLLTLNTLYILKYFINKNLME